MIRKPAIMENQPPEKRRREGFAAGSINYDRISQLPEHILQNHILSFLPQQVAVRTCLLSKSWRHLGPTRPKLEFHESYFRGNKLKFEFVVENTLKRYFDQNLPLHEFVLGYNENSYPDQKIQNNWIPIVIKKMGVKTFNLTAHNFYQPPSVVFQAEFLEKLCLEGCNLDQTCINVKLQMLKRLSLCRVYIKEETFDKIMLSCPLIEHLVLENCKGLETIKVKKARNLKHYHHRMLYTHEIEMDDAPSLETIHIEGGVVKPWFVPHNNYFFPRLKSLYLQAHLPTELLSNLSSNNCPCLEELQLHYCSGFSEFELSNRSIKRLIIRTPGHLIEVISIDAANLLHFEFRGDYLPSISFATTTSREWKSYIHVWWRYSSDSKAETWYLKLHEFLKALSQSQISLNISDLPFANYDGGSCEPVVIEFLRLSADYPYYPSSELPNLLNCLFRTCRPRYIDMFLYAASSHGRYLMAESFWKALVRKGKKRPCHFWKQDLEDSSIQVLDKNTNEWRSVQVRALPNNERVRFRLKWRDLS